MMRVANIAVVFAAMFVTFVFGTDAPTSVPTAMPSSTPTSLPSAVPTAVSSQHINVHLVDLHGDGWYDDLYLAVHHNDTYGEPAAEPSLYSLHCACKVVRIFSITGNMTLSIHRNNISAPLKHAPYEWEVLWAVGYSDGVVTTSFDVYGDVNTVVPIVEWGLGKVRHGLDTNAQAPKNRCTKPSPKRSLAAAKSKPAPPPPPVDITFQLGESHKNGWCDDSGDSHAYFCSKEGDLSPDASLPNLLTYPRYFIADTDTYKVIQSGTMNLDVRNMDVTVPLPSEGSFVFSVSGHYLSGNTLTWNFCGLSGTISQRVHFRMRDGLCEATDFEPLDDPPGDQCKNEWSTGMLILSPIVPLGESESLSAIRYDVNVLTVVAAITGLLALALVVATTMRRPNAAAPATTDQPAPSERRGRFGKFVRLDTTEHATP